MSENAISPGLATISSEALPFVRGVSPAMRALERVIIEIAPTDVPILLIGESGTGKETVALEAHRRSKNSDKPFVKFSCAGSVLEFLRIHLGQSANTSMEPIGGSGTALFDDIGRLEAASQDILLQFLSDISSAPKRHALFPRVISSTPCYLEEEMRAGRFRQELYYRINGVGLRLPPLRERPEDLPLLLDHFLKTYARKFERPEPRLSPTAMDFLAHHSWPGNVRELENFARKLVILGDEELALSDLVLSSGPNTTLEVRRRSPVNGHPNQNRSLKAVAREASRNVERELILNSLERTHWNRKRTARDLQISYKALLYKLKQLDLQVAPDLERESAQAIRDQR